MKIVNNIPIQLKLEDVMKKLHPDKKNDSFTNIQEILETSESLIKAGAVYKVAYIEKKGEDTVTINGVTFSSRVLRINLEKVERVFPYIITIGGDLENEASSCGDLMNQYYLETIGDMAIDSGMQYLEKHLKEQYGIERLSNMSPGSLEDWPITEQKPLFSLFGEENPAGVNLTDYMLMIPRKSISGILFPTEVSFFSCQLCQRENCPSRVAPYDEAIKKKYRLEDDKTKSTK